MKAENFEMPTPCQHCGEIFDLHDGYGSEKWYPNTTICNNCWEKEKAEIEEDERWEDLNTELSDALFMFKDENASSKISKENWDSILHLLAQAHSEDHIVPINEMVRKIFNKSTSS